ncbi:MAG: flavin reductase family protein [Oscillospiraceae bacterium]|nr:flavin reductase family protein [Oscillospiraceae bacterium]
MDFTKDLSNALKHLTTNGAFLSTKNGNIINTMTISWGYVGFMWNKPYFITLVRPQRYTKKIIDKATSFTISIPYDKLKDELMICGTKSGADIDKGKVVKFIPAKSVDGVVIDGCDTYYECNIRMRDRLKEENIPEDALDKHYKGDYHYLYFGEIVDCY